MVRCLALGAVDVAVQQQRLADLVADRVQRRERAHRLLEDDRDPAAADRAPDRVVVGVAREIERLVAAARVAKDDLAAADPRALRQDAEDRLRDHGLARAALADQRDRLAGLDREADAAHRLRPRPSSARKSTARSSISSSGALMRAALEQLRSRRAQAARRMTRRATSSSRSRKRQPSSSITRWWLRMPIGSSGPSAAHSRSSAAASPMNSREPRQSIGSRWALTWAEPGSGLAPARAAEGRKAGRSRSAPSRAISAGSNRFQGGTRTARNGRAEGVAQRRPTLLKLGQDRHRPRARRARSACRRRGA